MDSFEKCWRASEKASWRFQDAFGELQFDFNKYFLPSRLSGHELPDWLAKDERLVLSQIRGFSYAHIFLFVEEFIIALTHQSANDYIHVDNEALSALVRFFDDLTKHHRMFTLVKDRIAQGLGFRPAELPNKEETARQICAKPPFTVYLLTLALEYLTQRHYVECFSEEENRLDPTFVSIFRLHWKEEAQHTRIDVLELERLAAQMTDTELCDAVREFGEQLLGIQQLLAEQDRLDLNSFERVLGRSFTESQRAELLTALHREFLWTFIISGLEHRTFKLVYRKVTPPGALSLQHFVDKLRPSH